MPSDVDTRPWATITASANGLTLDAPWHVPAGTAVTLRAMPTSSAIDWDGKAVFFHASRADVANSGDTRLAEPDLTTTFSWGESVTINVAASLYEGCTAQPRRVSDCETEDYLLTWAV